MPRCPLTGRVRASLIADMRSLAGLLIAMLFSAGAARGFAQGRVLEEVKPLPVSLSNDFEFRKTKIFSLGVTKDTTAKLGKKKAAAAGNEQPEETPTPSKKKAPEGTGNRLTAAIAEASITFESRYRNFGAVTKLDENQRSGDYFDFFWRAKRNADITVRFEYQQEKLHAFTQAREIRCPDARGSHQTEFAIIGDDYIDDGRVIAWRCLLIEKGRVVAEKRSYLWK